MKKRICLSAAALIAVSTLITQTCHTPAPHAYDSAKSLQIDYSEEMLYCETNTTSDKKYG